MLGLNLNKKKEKDSEPTEKKPGPFDKIKTYFWGSEDKPLPPFSVRAKIKRWYLVHFKNYVYYITTMYDKQADEYWSDMDCVPLSSLPKEAVHVTRMKHTWHYDLDLPKRGFDSSRDNGFTAYDAYLYMKCSKIDEAMKIDLDDKKDVDMMKMLTIICVACGVIFALYIMFMR